mgnify:CR=1 FL=1
MDKKIVIHCTLDRSAAQHIHNINIYIYVASGSPHTLCGVARWVIEPGVLGGTPDTGVHSDLLPCQLAGRELAAVGNKAVRAGPGVALHLPRFIVLGQLHGDGSLHPLDDLGLCDEVDLLTVLLQNLVDPVEEGVEELRVVLEPGGVVEETQGSPVLVEVSVEVVEKEVVELLAGQNTATGVNHGAAWQLLIDGGIIPTVQLIHDHLPRGVGPGRAVLQVAVASVGHSEVHGVGPERRVLQRGSDGRVVEEGLLLNHGKLVVASHSEVGGPHANHAVVADIGKLLDDQPGARHLAGPVLHVGRGPEGLVVVVGDGVGSDLVAQTMHVLHSAVVGVLVRHKEGSLYMNIYMFIVMMQKKS